MKGIYRVFILVCVTIIFLAGLGKNVTGTTPGSFDIAQSSGSSDQKVLEVALPEAATVRLSAGPSYTGELTAFDSTDLTISSNGYSETVPLAQIQQVEFQGDVWIPNPNGQLRAVRIRGYPVTLEEVPVGALEISISSNGARLNLSGVLTDEEFARLATDPDQIHAVTKILFKPSNVMEVTVRAVRR